MSINPTLWAEMSTNPPPWGEMSLKVYQPTILGGDIFQATPFFGGEVYQPIIFGGDVYQPTPLEGNVINPPPWGRCLPPHHLEGSWQRFVNSSSCCFMRSFKNNLKVVEDKFSDCRTVRHWAHHLWSRLSNYPDFVGIIPILIENPESRPTCDRDRRNPDLTPIMIFS